MKLKDMENALANKSELKAKHEKREIIEPMSLDKMTEQPNGQNPVINARPPRKNVKANLPARKWGKVHTKRYSFEITPELLDKLNRRVAEITLTTGKKVSASEIIRQALARELRDI